MVVRQYIAVAQRSRIAYQTFMRSVIVPVFSQADLEALPNCLRYLAQQNVETLLVLHGPNVGVVNADATKEFDQRISNLDTRKRELVLVDDFEGAKKAKEEIETLRVERDMAIREGWKKVPEDQRAAAYKEAFSNIGTEPLCLREAYQPDQVFAMLQAFLPQWPSDIQHGEYSLVWPRSVATVSAQKQGISVSPGVAKAWKEEREDKRSYREQQLRKSKFMGIKAAAVKAGVYEAGMSTDQLVEAVLAKEYPSAVAA